MCIFFDLNSLSKSSNFLFSGTKYAGLNIEIQLKFLILILGKRSLTYKIRIILSSWFSNTGILEKPFSINLGNTSSKDNSDDNANKSTLGHITWLISIVPKFTIPLKIFSSSSVVSFCFVNSRAFDNSSTENLPPFCPNLFSMKSVIKLIGIVKINNKNLSNL